MRAAHLVLLAWTDHFYGDGFLVSRTVTDTDGSAIDLEVTADRRALDRADVVWFHGPSVKDLPARTGVPWAVMTMESPTNDPFTFSPAAQRLFDLHCTYRLDSDVPAPYANWHQYPDLASWAGADPGADPGRPPGCYQAVTSPTPPTERRPAILYLASNPVPERDAFVDALSRHVPVEAPGRCLHNIDLSDVVGPRKVNDPAQVATILDCYPLVLAFENSRHPDYATEKLFRPLASGTVPVTWSPDDLTPFLPRADAAIAVSVDDAAAATGARLAGLLDDPVRLARHRSWWDRPGRATEAFRATFDVGSVEPLTRLARKVRHGCDRSCRCGGRLRARPGEDPSGFPLPAVAASTAEVSNLGIGR